MINVMLNKAQVIGQVGQEPKVTVSQDGRVAASFSVGTTDRAYTAPDGKRVSERAEWHNVICFGRMAEAAGKRLHGGSRVFVEGKMRTRSYEDRNGVKRYVTEINAENLVVLDGNGGDEGEYGLHRREWEPGA